MDLPLLNEVREYLKASGANLSGGLHELLALFYNESRTLKELSIPADALQASLSRHTKVLHAGAFRQRLKRLNDALAADDASFRLRSAGRHVLLQVAPRMDERVHLDKVGAAISDLSAEATKLDKGGLVEPLATPEHQTLWVFVSYARLNEEENAIQVEFSDRLAEKLAYPPREFCRLPKIRLWRDRDNLTAVSQGTSQINQACLKSFLGLLLLSDKYLHSQMCQHEASFFLREDGKNRKNKFCLSIGVNVDHNEVDGKFTAQTRQVVVPKSNKNLVALWSRGNDADRLEFLKDIAREVFLAAKQYMETLPDDRKPPRSFRHSARSTDSIAQVLLRFSSRGASVDSSETIVAKAFAGRISPSVTPPADVSVMPEGIPIVEHLITWATDASDSTPRLFALLGEFGMGKTVACQLFTQELLKRGRDNPTVPIPVYFDLRQLERVDQGLGSLGDLIDQMLRKISGDSPSAREVIDFVRGRNTVVIFDGLDEVTNKLSPEMAIRLYRQLLTIVPTELWVKGAARRRRGQGNASSDAVFKSPRVLVSCRTHYFRDVAAQRGFLTGMERAPVDADSDIAVFFMLPFSPRQVEQYLILHLGDADARRALSLISGTYKLKELATRPIFLRFIREIFGQIEREVLAGRTINLARLYDIIVDRAFERDNPKHIIPIREKRLILEALALYLHKRQQSEIRNDRLDEWFQEYAVTRPRLRAELQRLGSLTLSEIFAQDLRNASFLVRPGEKDFQFAHSSIREFFLGRALYAAARAGSAEHGWDVELPSHETMEFLLEHHAIEERSERQLFETHFRCLLARGARKRTRELAMRLWLRAFYTGVPLPRPEIIDLSGLQLRREMFRGTERNLLPLQNSLWHDSRLNQASFENVDLSGADFSGATLPFSSWLKTRLGGATFSGTDLTGSNWRECDLGGVNFSNVLSVGSCAVECRSHPKSWAPRVVPPGPKKWSIRSLSTWPQQHFSTSSLDGKTVLVTTGSNDTIIVIDVLSGQHIAIIQLPSDPRHLCIATADANGQSIVAVGSRDGPVRIYDLSSGRQILAIKDWEGDVSCLEFVAVERQLLLVCGCGDGYVRTFDFGSAKQLNKIHVFRKHEEIAILSLAVVPGPKPLVIVGGGGHRGAFIHSFELLTPRRIMAYNFLIGDREDYVWCLATFKHRGQIRLAAGCSDGGIRIFALPSGKQLSTIEGDDYAVYSMAAAEINGLPVLVAAGSDGSNLIDLSSGRRLGRLDFTDMAVHEVAFTVRNQKLAIVLANEYGTIQVCDEGLGVIAVIGRNDSPPRQMTMAVQNGQRLIVSARANGEISIFDSVSGEQVRRIAAHTDEITAIQVSELDGSPVVVSAGRDHAIRAFDLSTGQKVGGIEGLDDVIFCLSSIKDRGIRAVVTAENHGAVRVLDLIEGKELAQLGKHQSQATRVILHKQGEEEFVVSGGSYGEILISSLRTGTVVRKIQVAKQYVGVNSLAVSRLRGKLIILAGCYDGMIRVLDFQSGKLVSNWQAHPRYVFALGIFESDETIFVVSGGDDGRIRIFDLKSLAEVAMIDQDRCRVSSFFTFEHEGKFVVVAGGSDGVIRIVKLRKGSFDLEVPLSINLESGAYVRVVRDRTNGEALLAASENAWRDFAAEYETTKEKRLVDLNKMPVAR